MDYNYKMRLGDDAFNAIRFGDKVFEGRLLDKKRSEFKVGDVVRCVLRSSDNIFVDVRIVELRKYDSFKVIFSELGGILFGFDEEDSADDFLSCYRKYYSEEDEKRLGVVGIKIELIV